MNLHCFIRVGLVMQHRPQAIHVVVHEMCEAKLASYRAFSMFAGLVRNHMHIPHIEAELEEACLANKANNPRFHMP